MHNKERLVATPEPLLAVDVPGDHPRTQSRDPATGRGSGGDMQLGDREVAPAREHTRDHLGHVFAEIAIKNSPAHPLHAKVVKSVPSTLMIRASYTP